MTISEIYKKYPVHHGLQEHMIRVAAVAKQICNNFEGEIDTKIIVTACLLHDMGNLLKSTPADLPELFQPEGVEYWEAAKQEAINKYGTSVKVATFAMIQELDVSAEVIAIVEEAQYERLAEIAASGSLEGKVLEYADMRVGLTGIIPLQERFGDIRARYVPSRFTDEELDEKYEAAKMMEKEIFAKASISPEDITDASTESIQAELWNQEV